MLKKYDKRVVNQSEERTSDFFTLFFTPFTTGKLEFERNGMGRDFLDPASLRESLSPFSI